MSALVFVHGFMGGGAQWAEQITFLSPYFQVITPDLPGFGEKNAHPACASIPEFAESMLLELTKQGIAQFHLVGHSMGGMIAQQMAFMAPERILSQIFYGTGSVGALPDRFETIARSQQRVLTDGAQATAEHIAATWFLHRRDDPAYPGCADIARLTSAQAMITALGAMQRWSGVKQLAHLPGKALVLWGDQDRTYPWQQTEQLWRGITDAHLAVVPQAAHAVHLEKSDLFNRLLLDFLLDTNSTG